MLKAEEFDFYINLNKRVSWKVNPKKKLLHLEAYFSTRSLTKPYSVEAERYCCLGLGVVSQLSKWMVM